MHLKHGSLGGVTLGNHIYAVGGGNGHFDFNDVEYYEPVLDKWIPSTKMLEKVSRINLCHILYMNCIVYRCTTHELQARSKCKM
jgi:hypothetical protein